MNGGTLHKNEIKSLIKDNHLFIHPILDENQIGDISIDLRVGTDFLFQHQGRSSYINTSSNDISSRSIKSNFTQTRRKIGENFLLHPFQPTLFSTLEYIKLPNNVYAVLSLRSSYSRLGLTMSTILQPGYCGCISVEIINSGNTPIEIVSGVRFLQARLIKVDSEKLNYFNDIRKYACQVRPVPSKANEDKEIEQLKKLS
ncbi:dCTP deaminase [Chryseobacterium polytrichastri]|uniref:dCTP deaminase n=1 Tax=Chryseobacterium polytrichastri TaxID=1302687 RepID=A0A1M7EWM8_9FLAO|nr:dCTP deaminase [Chryseobacterium polytrichastri]SHL96192.1 dCTP deaminase [Chryseobacterium polytrichastri]